MTEDDMQLITLINIARTTLGAWLTIGGRRVRAFRLSRLRPFLVARSHRSFPQSRGKQIHTLSQLGYDVVKGPRRSDYIIRRP